MKLGCCSRLERLEGAFTSTFSRLVVAVGSTLSLHARCASVVHCIYPNHYRINIQQTFDARSVSTHRSGPRYGTVPRALKLASGGGDHIFANHNVRCQARIGLLLPPVARTCSLAAPALRSEERTWEPVRAGISRRAQTWPRPCTMSACCLPSNALAVGQKSKSPWLENTAVCRDGAAIILAYSQEHRLAHTCARHRQAVIHRDCGNPHPTAASTICASKAYISSAAGHFSR